MQALERFDGVTGEQVRRHPATGQRHQQFRMAAILHLSRGEAALENHVAGHQARNEQQHENRFPGMILGTYAGRYLIALGFEKPPSNHGNHNGNEYRRGGNIFENIVNRAQRAAQPRQGVSIGNPHQHQSEGPQGEDHKPAE